MTGSAELHLHLHFDRSCNGCCNTNDRRVIGVSNELSLPSRCWGAFKRSCCCLQAPEDADEVNNKLETFIVDKIGKGPTKAAQELAGIDLTEKKDEQNFLFEREARLFVKEALFLQKHLERMDAMVAQIGYSVDTTSPPGSPEQVMEVTEFYDAHTPQIMTIEQSVSSYGEVDLSKVNVREFIKKELSLIPAKYKLSLEETESIIACVARIIDDKGLEKVNKVLIRKLIHENIRFMNIATEPPSFVQEIDPETLEDLRERFHIDQLTPRQIITLVKILRKEHKSTPRIDQVD